MCPCLSAGHLPADGVQRQPNEIYNCGATIQYADPMSFGLLVYRIDRQRPRPADRLSNKGLSRLVLIFKDSL